MTQLRASMLLTANADQAKAELRATKKEADGVTKASEKLGRTGRSSGAGVKQLGNASKQSAADLARLSAEERQAANDAVQVGRTHNAAAGSVSNLIAQYNDIGMMMMAGQNPLQLAIQQGTQITQIMGDLRSRGVAVGPVLRNAFMSMLNPMNLVTLAAIAAGAAMTQWLFGAGEEAKKLEDLISEAADAIEAFDQKADRGALSTSKMLEEFGTADPVLKAVLQDMAALGKIDAYQALDRTADSLRSMFEGWESDAENIAEFLGKRGLNLLNRDFNAIVGQIDRLSSKLSEAEDPAVKLQAAIALREVLQQNLPPLEQMTAEQKEFYSGLGAIIRDLTLMGVKVREVEQAQSGFADEYAGVMGFMAERARLSAEEQASAQEMLSSLQEQAALNALISEHGAQSAEVAQFRVEAERAAAEALFNSWDIADSLKQELMAAWDAANGVAGSNMSGSIAAAVPQAAALAQQLGIAASAALTIINARSSKVYSGRGGNPADFAEGGSKSDYESQLGYVPVDQLIEKFTPKVASRSGGGGGGAQAIDREREAIERLLDRERERLELLRETDPVAQEMIRHRETMAGATDQEREALRALIAERKREAEALDKSKEMADALRDAFDEVLLRGGDLGDMFANLLYQAAMYGEGPLGSLFGGSGLMNMIFPGLEFADGGYLTGAGGSRQDKMPILGSPGEFMVNAAATSRYRHLLEHINAGGDVSGFASGGMIGAGSAATPAPSAQGGLFGVLRIALGDGLKAELLEASGQMQVEIMEGFVRSRLPHEVKRINDDPRGFG